jgi:hypothetical protein
VVAPVRESKGYLSNNESLSASRRLLIGAFFTGEYAVESVALFNPSVVPHPNQRGLGAKDQEAIVLAASSETRFNLLLSDLQLPGRRWLGAFVAFAQGGPRAAASDCPKRCSKE